MIFMGISWGFHGISRGLHLLIPGVPEFLTQLQELRALASCPAAETAEATNVAKFCWKEICKLR
jgi:hypothetical protein